LPLEKCREVLECGRKLIIVGFSVFFGVGSVLQTTMTMMVTVGYLMLILSLNPYCDEEGKFSNNLMAATDHAALFIVLVGISYKWS
jgi:hypothetical protein